MSMDGPADEVPEGETSAETAGCPPEACGFNSPVLADRIFGELDVAGVPNARAMAIVELSHDIDPSGRSLFLDVRDGELVGLDPSSAAVVVSGTDMAGARIVVQRDTGNGPLSEWTLFVDEVVSVDRISDQPGTISGYRMSYSTGNARGSRRALCPDDQPALVIAGERYHERTLAIGEDASGRLFRLACTGHMLGKARRMSYDATAPADDAYRTTVAQRRATLAMLGADYCGTGERFTEVGTPLYWQNRAGWIRHGAPSESVRSGSAGRVEAAWNERGAICVDTPRLHERYTRADIEAACGRAIPACTDALMGEGEWITWIP